MSSNAKRYFQFFLIVLAAGAIFPIMYLRTNYQETLLQVFGSTLPQLNNIYSFLGIAWFAGYFPSGVICDKISAKFLLSISLFMTALGGFAFAQIPSYGLVVGIYVIWGVFSVFTFWGAHMKLVKLLSRREEEGRFFGILDGGRGVVEAALASVAVAIFAAVLGKSDSMELKTTAMKSVIYMYSFVVLAIAVLVTIFVGEDKKEASRVAAEAKPKEKFEWKDLGTALRNKFIYLLGGIIFMSYTTYWTVYYYGGFLETNIKVPAVTVGIVTVIVMWMRPVGGIVGGFLADKVGKTRTLGGALIGALVCLALMSFVPPGAPRPLFFTVVVLAGVFVYAIRGLYWSLMGDCKIEDKIIGITIGTASVMGYLPDIVLPQFNSFLFNTFGGDGGYNAYFVSSGVIAVIGIILVSVFGKLSRKA
ncbi:MAG: MFS transporter [Spirochaetaceae bacterium]|jgi:MFS family permease|nr:MFS transporter [Spirochaetaceae bacterium]